MSLHSQAVHGCCRYEDHSKCKIHRIGPDAADLVRELTGQPPYEKIKSENERLRAALGKLDDYLRKYYRDEEAADMKRLIYAALEPE